MKTNELTVILCFMLVCNNSHKYTMHAISLLFDILADGERLFVSEAFHEARIEVTEDGTKAGSATGM